MCVRLIDHVGACFDVNTFRKVLTMVSATKGFPAPTHQQTVDQLKRYYNHQI